MLLHSVVATETTIFTMIASLAFHLLKPDFGRFFKS